MGRDEILSNQYPSRWLQNPSHVTQLACPSSVSPADPDQALHSTPPPSTHLSAPHSAPSHLSLIPAPPSRPCTVAPPLLVLVFPASIPPHLINMVDSRAQVPLLLRLVWGMPVAHWEQHRFRFGDTKKAGGF